jgi:ribosomal protein S21
LSGIDTEFLGDLVGAETKQGVAASQVFCFAEHNNHSTGGESTSMTVQLKHGETVESLLKRFRKRVNQEKILSTARKKRRFTSKSEERRAALRKAMRRERKRRRKMMRWR